MAQPRLDDVFAWLDDHQVPDSIRQTAYEHASPALRSQIKQAIHCLYKSFGTRHTHAQHTLIHDGEMVQSTEKPYDWVVLLLSAQKNACARITCQAILPRLAGVAHIIACFEAMPAKESLLALELCGIDDIVLDDEPWSLPPLPGSLGVCSMRDSLPTLPHTATLLLAETPPRLGILDPEAFDSALLASLHGSLPKTVSAQNLPVLDALFLAKVAKEDPALCANSHLANALLLTPGFEGFWLYPNLTPQSFTTTTRLLCAAPPNPFGDTLC
ncbi:MAG: hypothetical protein IJS54_05805 [Desulfovibrio sp.]|nr:hypothetical protein [Desulfovibrio sp.]